MSFSEAFLAQFHHSGNQSLPTNYTTLFCYLVFLRCHRLQYSCNFQAQKEDAEPAAVQEFASEPL